MTINIDDAISEIQTTLTTAKTRPEIASALLTVMRTPAFAQLIGVEAGAVRMSELAEKRVAHAMHDLRKTTNQHVFVEAFLAVMGLEEDGVRVRMNLTWPRPKAAPKPPKKTKAAAARA